MGMNSQRANYLLCLYCCCVCVVCFIAADPSGIGAAGWFLLALTALEGE